jgi:ferredoxin/flavodoxin---NADP+ reductase
MSAIETQSNVKFKPVTVLSNTEINPNVFLLSFRRDFDFRAGQVLGIALSQNEDARLYSIASGETDENITLLYNIKPGGKLTPSLAERKPGDTLYITVPFGSYLGTEGKAWWIGAGTGIAPFYSMLRSGSAEGKTLIHGSRTPDAFYFSSDISERLGDHYIRCCSAEEGPGLFSGRVTDYLKTFDELPDDQKYYLCGGAEMVVDCREILLDRGVPFGNIVAEIYF